MISNYVSEARQRRIKEERATLSARMMELRQIISGLGITPSQVKLRSKNIDERSWMVRDNCLAEIAQIEQKLIVLNKERMELHGELSARKNNSVMRVFDEIFSDEQKILIYKEAERRRNGEEPIPIGLNLKDLDRYKEGFYEYKSIAKEQLDKMIEFRIMLTGLIEKGCEQFGNAEFLKFISPLNKLIIPVNELKKIKIKHLL